MFLAFAVHGHQPQRFVSGCFPLSQFAGTFYGCFVSKTIKNPIRWCSDTSCKHTVSFVL